MEPNKFEENIRTKFEERELQPSAEAWSKLEAQLGESTSNNKTLWYAIAASLVAMLVVGSFLLKDTKTVSNEIVEQIAPSETLRDTQVVTSEKNNTPENNIVEDKTEVETEIETKILPQKKQEFIANIPEKRKAKTENKKERSISENVETAETAIATTVKTPEHTKVTETLKPNDFINLKVEEVVAQVENLKTKNTNVTVEDVDALLRKAQRDIANQRLLNNVTAKIDPASLLNDVESELEQGFRDKVFDALGEGFHKIRTAVVERNN